MQDTLPEIIAHTERRLKELHATEGAQADVRRWRLHAAVWENAFYRLARIYKRDCPK